MKTKSQLVIGLMVSFFTLSANAAIEMNCKGQIRTGMKMAMSIKMENPQQLISAKAFYLSSGSKPVFAGGIGHRVATPGKRNPDTTVFFKSEGSFMDSTTLYLPKTFAQTSGSQIKALLVLTADGVEPGAADFVCTIR